MRLFQVLILFLLVMLPLAAVLADEVPVPPPVTADAVNAADLTTSCRLFLRQPVTRRDRASCLPLRRPIPPTS